MKIKQSGGVPKDVVLTADQIREKLPQYTRDGLSLGTALQRGDTAGPALEIERILRGLAPGVKKWKGVEEAVEALTKSVEGTVSDAGGLICVKGDGKHYELRVRTRMNLDGIAVRGKGDYTLDTRSKVKMKTGIPESSKRQANLAPVLNFTGLPGVVVQIIPAFPVSPTEEISGDARQELADSSAISFFSPHEVDIPLDVSFTLHDEAGTRIAATTERANAVFSVPVDLASDDNAGKRVIMAEQHGGSGSVPPTWEARLNERGITRVTQPLPTQFVPESVVVNRSASQAGTFPEQVMAGLGERYAAATAVGTEGRAAIHASFSEANIARRLREMTATAKVENGEPVVDPESGWIDGPRIFKGKNRGGFEWRPRVTQVQMRAVPRWVKVVETRDNVAITERRHEHFGHVSGSQVKRHYGFNAFVGGGADFQPGGTVAGGVTASAGVERQSGRKVDQSHAGKHAVEITGDSVRYDVVYDVEFRMLGERGKTPTKLDGNVSATNWTGKRQAGRAGLVAEDPADSEFRTGDQRTKRGPREFESGEAMLGTMDEFTSGELLTRALEPIMTQLATEKGWYLDKAKFLRHLQNRRSNKWRFLQSFTTSSSADGQLTGKLAEALQFRCELRDALTPAELNHLRDRMVQTSLHIPLRKAGWLYDRTETVVLTATTGELEEGNLLTGEQIRGIGRSKDTMSTEVGKGRETEAGGGPQARALGPFGSLPSSSPFGTVLLGLRWSRSWTRDMTLALGGKRNIERKRGDTLDEDGTLGDHKVRQFRTTMTISTAIEYSKRHRETIRKISFGRHGRHAPEVKHLTAPDDVTFDLRMLVPEDLLVDRNTPDDPGPAPSPRPSVRLTNPPPPLKLADRPAMSRAFDGVEITAMTAAPEIQKSTLDMLDVATGNDVIVRAHNAAISRAINSRLSPESLKNDPRLFNRTTIVNVAQLHHGRRWDDLVATVGVKFTPRLSARQVSAEEYQQVIRELEGSTKVTGNKGTLDQYRGYVVAVARMTQKPFTAVSGSTNDVAPRGLFVVSASPYSVSRGASAATHIKNAEKFSVGTLPQRMVLARVDIEATVVAEAGYVGNLSFGLAENDAPKIAGEVVDLPEAALVWLTEDQFAELKGETPAHSASARADETGIEPPASLRPHAAACSSIGLGGIIEPIDLAWQIAELREQISASPRGGPELAARLLPVGELNPKDANIEAVQRFLDESGRMVNSLINGGTVAPTPLAGRFSDETYDLVVDASFTEAPKRGTVRNLLKLKSSVSTELGTKTTANRTRTLLSAVLSARPMIAIREQSGAPAQDGRAHGQTGAGVGVGGSAGVRERKKVAESTRKYTTTGSTKGPVALHDGKLDVRIRLMRDGRTIAAVTTTTDVSIHKIAEESFPAPEFGGRLGSAEAASPVRTAELSYEDLRRWRGATDGGRATVKLPERGRFWVEHFFGDVQHIRDAAKAALVESLGIENPATDPRMARIDRSLRIEFVPASVRAGLVPATEGTFRISVDSSLGRTVEVHARIPRTPRFASASATVEVNTYNTATNKEEVKVTTGPKAEAIQTGPVAAGGESDTIQGTTNTIREPFDSKSGSAHPQSLTLAGPDSLKMETSGESDSPARKQRPDAADDKLTRVLLAGVDFRVVVRGTTKPLLATYQDIRFHDAFALRTRDSDATAITGTPLPPNVADATKELAAQGKTWLDAEKKRIAADTRLHDLERVIASAERKEAHRRVNREDRITDLSARLHSQQDTVLEAEAQFRRSLTTGAESTRDCFKALSNAKAELRRLQYSYRKQTAAARLSGTADTEVLTRYCEALSKQSAAVEVEQQAKQAWWAAKGTYDSQIMTAYASEYRHHDSQPSPPINTATSSVGARQTQTKVKAAASTASSRPWKPAHRPASGTSRHR